MARFWATSNHATVITSGRRWFTATSRALTYPPALDDHIGPPPLLLLPPPVVFSCTCGRKFNSVSALNAHRKAKAEVVARVCTAEPAKAKKWLWKHVRAEQPIRRIEFAAVRPSDTPVSSAAASELVCSYNWRRRGAKLLVPGT